MKIIVHLPLGTDMLENDPEVRAYHVQRMQELLDVHWYDATAKDEREVGP